MFDEPETSLRHGEKHMRIRGKLGKAGFIVAALAVEIVLGYTVLDSLPVIPLGLAGAVYVIACFYIGSRIFRGKDESNLPRERLRMTGGPTSAFVVGSLLAIWAVGLFINFLLAFIAHTGKENSEAIASLGPAVLAILYFRSGFAQRLRKAEKRMPGAGQG